MDPQSNEELMRFYNDRDAWVVQPDLDGGRLTVLSAPQPLLAAK